MKRLNNFVPFKVLLEPKMISLDLARVNATLILLQSFNNSPTFPVSLDRTSEIRIQSLSRPWYLSTVCISINGLFRKW